MLCLLMLPPQSLMTCTMATASRTVDFWSAANRVFFSSTSSPSNADFSLLLSYEPTTAHVNTCEHLMVHVYMSVCIGVC